MAKAIKWKFKKDAYPQGSSDGFWYDLNNGYIRPDEVLKDPEQVKALEEARALLESFEEALSYAGLLNAF